MNLFQHFRDEVVHIVNQLADEGRLPVDLETARVSVEPPREATHGDITTNAAGSVYSGRDRKSASSYRRKHTPGAIRPHRPMRWLALAWEMGSMGRRCSFDL